MPNRLLGVRPSQSQPWTHRVSGNDPRHQRAANPGRKNMNRKFILLVEDNPDDEILVLRALKKNQIVNDVEVVRDGVAALDFLFATGPCCGRDASDLPTVVLLDLRLPRMHGFQVLRRIRADRRTQDLPVIIITASREVEGILSGYSVRADGYARKTARLGKSVSALGHPALDGLPAGEPSA